jgi:membrane protein YqaA with SNARE-associated domain
LPPDILVYLGLCGIAFVAATIFPAQSEAVLVGLILSGHYPVWALLLAAGIGNVSGSVVNWGLGRGIDRFRHKRWFPVSEDKLVKAEAWYNRYGKWSLLAAWLPVIGDALTIMAGVLRVPLVTFVILITISKMSRYLVLTLITLEFL